MLEEFTYDPALRHALHDGFLQIIEKEVKTPPQVFGFDASNSDMLDKIIRLIKGDRAIVAIHDPTCPSRTAPTIS